MVEYEKHQLIVNGKVIKSFKFASKNDKYRCFFLVFVVFLDGLIKTTPYRISSFFRGFRDFSI